MSFWTDSYKAVGPNLYVDPSTGQMYNNQLQGDSENGFTRAMVPTGDIWEYQNTPGISGQNIYGSQGYSPQQYEKGGEGDWGSTGSPGGFTAAGYQLGNWQSDPNLSSYLQSRGITPTYDAQYGWIIPNAANPGQIMTDYVRSRGLGDANAGGFVNSLIDKYAVPAMMAATGAGMAGGFGGVAAEGGGAGATTGVTVPGNYSSAMGTMGGDVAAGAGTTSAYGLTGTAPGIAGTAGGGITNMGAPVDYSLAGGAGAGANVGSAGLGGTSAMLGGAGAAGGAAAGAGAGINYLTNPSVLGGIISGGAGLLGAGLQANAARDAAQGIADANISSNQLMARINEQNRARQEPFYQAGLSALPAYTQGVMPGGNLVRPFAMSDYQADPGYGFRMSEGLKALDRSAASRGNLLSGSTLKGATRYSQDLASQEYNNAYNRYVGNQATQRNALAGLTGFAPTASSAMQAGDVSYGSNAANLASNTANAMAGAGATRASSYGNALAGIGQNIYNTMNPNPINAMMAQYMQSQMAPKTGVTG